QAGAADRDGRARGRGCARAESDRARRAAGQPGGGAAGAARSERAELRVPGAGLSADCGGADARGHRVVRGEPGDAADAAWGAGAFDRGPSIGLTPNLVIPAKAGAPVERFARILVRWVPAF